MDEWSYTSTHPGSLYDVDRDFNFVFTFYFIQVITMLNAVFRV
jgi:hypothetical protein